MSADPDSPPTVEKRMVRRALFPTLEKRSAEVRLEMSWVTRADASVREGITESRIYARTFEVTMSARAIWEKTMSAMVHAEPLGSVLLRGQP